MYTLKLHCKDTSVDKKSPSRVTHIRRELPCKLNEAKLTDTTFKVLKHNATGMEEETKRLDYARQYVEMTVSNFHILMIEADHLRREACRNRNIAQTTIQCFLFVFLWPQLKVCSEKIWLV